MTLKTEYHSKLHKVIKSGIKVYPVHKDGREIFAVQVEDPHAKVFKAKITTGEYKHTTKTIAKAITESVEWIYEKLMLI